MKQEPILSTKSGLLYQVDCMDLFVGLKDGTVHCIFADPPFNLGKSYGNGEVKMSLTLTLKDR